MFRVGHLEDDDRGWYISHYDRIHYLYKNGEVQAGVNFYNDGSGFWPTEDEADTFLDLWDTKRLYNEGTREAILAGTRALQLLHDSIDSKNDPAVAKSHRMHIDNLKFLYKEICKL